MFNLNSITKIVDKNIVLMSDIYTIGKYSKVTYSLFFLLIFFQDCLSIFNFDVGVEHIYLSFRIAVPATVQVRKESAEQENNKVCRVDHNNIPWERLFKLSPWKLKPNWVLYKQRVSAQPKERTNSLAIWIIHKHVELLGTANSNKCPNSNSCFA